MARTTYFQGMAALCVAGFGLSALAAGCSEDTTKPAAAAGDDAGNGANTSPVLSDNVAGGACTKSTDCKGTTPLCTTTFGIAGLGGTPAPGGYCTANCTSTDECGAGAECIGAFAAVSVKGKCQKTCTTDTDCGRDGYICSNLDISGIGAATDGGIDPSTLPTIPKSCVPKVVVTTLADGIVGKACTEDTACGTGTCALMTFLGQTYPGGYCVGRCAQSADCGKGGQCIGATVTPLGAIAGTCQKGCESNADCRAPEYSCLASRVAGGSKVCQLTPAPDGGVAAPDAGNRADAGVATDAGG